MKKLLAFLFIAVVLVSNPIVSSAAEQSGNITTISELSAMPEANVYRRVNGDLFLKLDDKYHIKVKLGEDKDKKPTWLGNGSVEELDPNEEVEVVQ